jgi:hypothetical protein
LEKKVTVSGPMARNLKRGKGLSWTVVSEGGGEGKYS